MPYIIAGLGNPGAEYENTRHNTGRMMLDMIRREYSKDEFIFNKKINALTASAKIGREKVTLVAPETFMNLSGKAIAPLVKVKSSAKLKIKTADNLIVIYDDFNLPLGRVRISYNRSSGGHYGLESIIKALKTEAFLRIRIGVAPEKANGTAKTPHGDDKINKFILGPYKDDEVKELKKVGKKVVEAVGVVLKEGKEKAMSLFNAG